MISHLKYNKSMESIHSYRQALDYKKEALEIPLDMLMTAIPENVVQSIKPQTFGAGIFIMDRILPEAWITSKDQFFLKNATGYEKVQPEPGMDPTKLYFSPGVSFMQDANTRMYPLSSYYGNFVSMARTTHACVRALGVHALFLYLKELGLYEVYQDIRLPSLSALVPGLNFENWKAHKTNEVLQGLAKVSHEIPTLSVTMQDEVLVDDEEYDGEVLRIISPRITPIMQSFSDFYEFDRDCFYRLELQPNHVRLIKGIDHKYLPYYEQKYPTT